MLETLAGQIGLRTMGPLPIGFEPNTLGDLVNVVLKASKEGHHIRVVGSGWSFENSHHFPPDSMVSLKNLNQPLHTVTDSALIPEWANRVFHVEAGATIADVNRLLESAGLALPTLGGANGQGLGQPPLQRRHTAGRFLLPPLPDLVMAMHLVTTDGREVWVERATQPITNDEPLMAALPCKKAFILRDDRVFEALLVGLGRFVLFEF